MTTSVIMSDENGHYEVPQLAYILHHFPHLSITFHPINSTFNPQDELYLEALGILASVPAAWLILSLFCLLVYLLTRCCDRNSRRKRSLSPLKWTLGIIAMVCCGVVAVGLYGNDDLHSGAVDFVTSTKQIDDYLASVRNHTITIETTLEHTVRPELDALSGVFGGRPVDNKTIHNFLVDGVVAMRDNVTKELDVVKILRDNLKPITIRPLYYYTQEVEVYRWPATLGLLSVLLLICVLLLAGLVRHSRCILITFSVFGLFAVIITWLLASVYIAIAVATADFCVAPTPYLESHLSSRVSADVVHYYLVCNNPLGAANPLDRALQEGEKALDGIRTNLETVSKVAAQYYSPSQLNNIVERIRRQGIEVMDDSLKEMAALFICTDVNRQYEKSLIAICDLGLFGLSFMLVSAAGSGLLFTVLVWMDSHTWIYIHKKPSGRTHSEERDPFLPASSSMNSRRSQGSYNSTQRPIRYLNHTPPSTPPFPGTLNGRVPREEKPHSHTHQHGPSAPSMLGPNNGQYPTLSKQCKTLESSDFY